MKQNLPGDAHDALRKYGRDSDRAPARESGKPDSKKTVDNILSIGYSTDVM